MKLYTETELTTNELEQTVGGVITPIRSPELTVVGGPLEFTQVGEIKECRLQVAVLDGWSKLPQYLVEKESKIER